MLLVMIACCLHAQTNVPQGNNLVSFVLVWPDEMLSWYVGRVSLQSFHRYAPFQSFQTFKASRRFNIQRLRFNDFGFYS